MTFVPPIVVRLFRPIAFLLPKGTAMSRLIPTVGLPECALCRRKSLLPPARLGWVAAGGSEVLILVCADYECSSDAELERRIIASLVGEQAGAVAA
jgi:hypothetical protein